jgi:hypothetical protein
VPTPSDGDSKPCPRCRQPLVFSSRYPILVVGLALTAAAVDSHDRLRYVRAWVCRNGDCDYREMVEER